MVRDTKSFYRAIVLGQLQSWTKHTLVHRHHFVNFHLSYVGCSGVDSQEIWGHHTFQDVYYVHIDKPYAILFFERWLIAKRTLYHVSKRRFVSHNRRQPIRYLS